MRSSDALLDVDRPRYGMFDRGRITGITTMSALMRFRAKRCSEKQQPQ